MTTVIKCHLLNYDATFYFVSPFLVELHYLCNCI